MTNGKAKKQSVRTGPSGSPSNGRSASSGRGMPTFLPITLTEQQKAAWSHWHNTGGDWVELLDAVGLAGYSISVRYDASNDTYMATITDRREDSQYVNNCYTLRARTAPDALSRVLWTTAVFAEGDWGQLFGGADPGDVW